ncbi:hypothetical protein BG61_07100 [Caballeronia glathei]|uniref:Uncharacterized protein n=1 Tax=Caballeronia glathei TaxID=60547 RepID=A0A069PKG1_9BURK|nr:hypothetical protein BG61_07100 [Caballeronia glathei]
MRPAPRPAPTPAHHAGAHGRPRAARLAAHAAHRPRADRAGNHVGRDARWYVARRAERLSAPHGGHRFADAHGHRRRPAASRESRPWRRMHQTAASRLRSGVRFARRAVPASGRTRISPAARRWRHAPAGGGRRPKPCRKHPKHPKHPIRPIRPNHAAPAPSALPAEPADRRRRPANERPSIRAPPRR